MRKPLGKCVARLSREYVSRLSLHFDRFNGRSQYLWPGDQPFVHPRNDVLLFLVLLRNPKYERFTFEFGWSKLMRFPEVEAFKAPNVSAGHHEFKLDEYMNRVGTFLGEGNSWDVETFEEGNSYFQKHLKYPDYTDDELNERVRKALDYAIEIVEKYVVTYFQDLIAYLDSQKRM